MDAMDESDDELCDGLAEQMKMLRRVSCFMNIFIHVLEINFDD